MDDALKHQIDRIIRAVQILSDTSFSFAGQHHSQPEPDAHQSRYITQKRLLDQLQRQLYRQTFCRRFAENYPRAPAPRDGQDEGLLQALSEANGSRGRWEQGWEIIRVEPSGQVLVEKQGRTRVLQLHDLASNGRIDPGIEIGSEITIRLDKETFTWQPGFYVAFGETPGIEEEEAALIRFYWNISSAGAVSLLGLLSDRLNRFQVPYQIKCPSYTEAYYRLDSTVLYVDRRFYRITAELLAGLYPRIADELEPETPLFTKELAPGLALAEDPGSGDSFGAHRCRIMAEGICETHLQGLEADHQRLTAVLQRFTFHGIDVTQPYLNPGSIDRYPFPVRTTESP